VRLAKFDKKKILAQNIHWHKLFVLNFRQVIAVSDVAGLGETYLKLDIHGF
jgi:hypothetical protein